MALSAFLIIGLFLPFGCDQPYGPDPEGSPAFSEEDSSVPEKPDSPSPEREDTETGDGSDAGEESDSPEKPDAGDEPEAAGEPDGGGEPEDADEPGGGNEPEIAGESGGDNGPATAGEPDGGDEPEAADEFDGEDEPVQPDAEDPILVSIEVQKPPKKLAYAKGEDLDTAGLEVLGIYNDGSTRLEDQEALQFSGHDKTKSGDQVVTITLEGKTAEFTVRVSLSGLNLDITRYQEGEMNILGIPEGGILLSRSGADGLTHELALQVEGYEQVWCFVNGTELSLSETGFILQASSYSVRQHVITFIGVKEGVPYGRELSFIVFE
jgi:hypothetical protein